MNRRDLFKALVAAAAAHRLPRAAAPPPVAPPIRSYRFDYVAPRNLPNYITVYVDGEKKYVPYWP